MRLLKSSGSRFSSIISAIDRLTLRFRLMVRVPGSAVWDAIVGCGDAWCSRRGVGSVDLLLQRSGDREEVGKRNSGCWSVAG